MAESKLISVLRGMAAVSFLATVAGDQPRLRAMTHYIDEDMNIWYPSIRNCGKVAQITANPRVAVSFLDYAGSRPPITIYGTATITDDPSIIKALLQQYPPEILKVVPADPDSDNFVFIKITPTTSIDNTYASA